MRRGDVVNLSFKYEGDPAYSADCEILDIYINEEGVTMLIAAELDASWRVHIVEAPKA